MEIMNVYVLNHCNKWHEYSSFRLIGVVDETMLQEALTKIKSKTVYTDEDMQAYIDVKEINLNDLDI